MDNGSKSSTAPQSAPASPDFAVEPPAPGAPIPFMPLDLDAFMSLAPQTRRAIAWDLALAKQGGPDPLRLSSMLPSLSFLHAPSSYDTRFDLCLGVALLIAWDGSRLPELFARVDADLSTARGNLHVESGSERDFGPAATWLCAKALIAKAEGDSGLFETLQVRALFLVGDGSKKMEQPLPVGSSYSKPNGCLHGVADMLAKTSEFMKPYHMPGRDMPVLAPALALAQLGERAVLDALLARPDTAPKLKSLFSTGMDYHRKSNSKEFILLESADFWRAAPELAGELRSKGCEAAAAAPGALVEPLPWAVARAALKASGLDASHPALAAAAAIRGDKLFAPDEGEGLFVKEALDLLAPLCRADPAALRWVKPWALRAFAPERAMRRDTMAPAMRLALFNGVAGFRELVDEGFRQVHGPEADPFAMSLGLDSMHQHLDALCKCERIDTATLALEAMGIHRAQLFPGPRKGLDYSLLMSIAAKAELPTFEAALDWFAAKDGLREQSEAKAWVYRGGHTSKKGDLLALCVALNLTGHARALLDRIPDLDVKPARELAKAMVRKVGGDGGSQVLSSFEELLLRRALEAKAAAQPPAPPRRARSL